MLLPATHEIDVMKFDYQQYPKDHFDIIWASPPCVSYSRLQNCWLGRKKKDGIVYTREIMENEMKESDKLVQRTLDIINYFNPELWFMENPATGKLKDRDVVKDISFYDVDYCKYSNWGYKKRTRIWTNKKNWNALICHNDCENMVKKQHRLNVSKDVHTIGEKKTKHKLDVSISVGGGTNKLDRYRVPEDLIYSLFLE